MAGFGQMFQLNNAKYKVQVASANCKMSIQYRSHIVDDFTLSMDQEGVDWADRIEHP